MSQTARYTNCFSVQILDKNVVDHDLSGIIRLITDLEQDYYTFEIKSPEVRKGPTRLWEFLVHLLNNPQDYSNLIIWESYSGQFYIRNPLELAEMWGRTKKKSNMTYEKLARALRYYYNKMILTKIPGKRHTYKFNLRLLSELRKDILSSKKNG
ncbi:DgyrCDS9063 [Dimorphilus gyrociliatus]|uniref:DgyrCDS9063 n=1 Tax=Dimorphilus gyrociliatus TaxID=2664684 RepID=A0A7I8VXQ5_9ANNE|nr:DgyrCDS9063 [Dimorphilus gyrociliatus]